MVPRDRVISSVVKENDELKERYKEVCIANDRLREELEDALSKKNPADMTEE